MRGAGRRARCTAPPDVAQRTRTKMFPVGVDVGRQRPGDRDVLDQDLGGPDAARCRARARTCRSLRRISSRWVQVREFEPAVGELDRR